MPRSKIASHPPTLPQPADPAAPVQSLDEIIALYPDEWVLLQITAYDADRIPAQGHVVGHWPPSKANDRRISQALEQVLGAPEKPAMPYYLFMACPRIRTGEAFREALARLVADAESGIDGAWTRR